MTPALDLLHAQVEKAAAKGYSVEHDRVHGPRRLILAGHALTRSIGGRSAAAGAYLWPFKDGWNPDPDLAVTLVKAAQLLLSAADVITAEREAAGS